MPDNPSYIHKLEGILEEPRARKPIPFFRRRDIEALFGLKKRQAVNLIHPHRGRPRQPGARRRPARPHPLAGTDDRKPFRHRGVGSDERVIGRIVELKAETTARSVKIVLPDRGLSVELPDGGFPPARRTHVAFETNNNCSSDSFC